MANKSRKNKQNPTPKSNRDRPYADQRLPNDSRQRTLWGLLAVACLAVLLVWLLRSYKVPADLAESDSIAQTQPTALDLKQAAKPLSDLEQLAFNPSREGWETEKHSAAALVQLKKILKIAASPQWPGDDLADYVLPNFRCQTLRPPQLHVVFEDKSLRVLRPDAAEPKTELVGAQGLKEALLGLREPFESTAKLRTEIKVVRVNVEEADVVTSAYVKLIGKNRAGILQQSATWKCRWQHDSSDQTLTLSHIEIDAFEETVSQTGRPLFSDCTLAVLGQNSSFHSQHLRGIGHWASRIPIALGFLDPAGKHGLCVGDVNGDGLDDLYIIEPAGLPNKLYVQNPDGTATDVSAESGVDILDPATSALLLDLDNDGDQDLIVTALPGLLFLENDGTGKFTPRAPKATPMGLPYSLAATDYDGDRDLDIYVCVYMPNVRDQLQLLGKPVPYHDANNGAISVLLQNEGDWRFRNVTKTVGLDVNNRRFSYAAAWEDYDNDGDQDLYVANDFGRNNLFRNEGGKFTDAARQAGVEDISAGMSVSWADFDRDGYMDLYVGNMFSSAGNRIAYQRRFNARATGETRNEFQRHARGNSLFKNSGDGMFADVSVDTGVTMGRWAWSSQFVDLNNDGWEDIVVANGFLTNDDSRDL